MGNLLCGILPEQSISVKSTDEYIELNCLYMDLININKALMKRNSEMEREINNMHRRFEQLTQLAINLSEDQLS